MQGYLYLSEDVRSYEKDRPWVRQGLLLEKGHIVRQLVFELTEREEMVGVIGMPT